ncbi:helix-turn-helix transcriptional regulator [Thermaerobacter sp. PB12/4term]|uniref:helix-turn-helix domain-containing protein n=1 Tax=Thermaerobacter sp. PB12/4term TaxID=2293838 RepID=UPI000E3254F3|nr:helix-turn-helix transcriptional regulator [Thermaerobacter sp. PB12/4term]QIA27171.1 helix-turn-helix transcriptional regulator [Thermaerobacter sp. PB12/4term]
MEVGKRIRDLRRQRGISLRDLARRSGVSKAYLSQLENDPARKPSVDVVLRIAAALQVDLAELVGPATGGGAAGEQAPGAGGAPPGEPDSPLRWEGAARAEVAAAGDRALAPLSPAPGSAGAPPATGPRASRQTSEFAPGPPEGGPRIPEGTPIPEGSPPALDQLPWALRVFWQEHPEVPEEEIRSLATITWKGRRPFTPTDYWVLHQVLTGMTRGL